MEEKRLKLLEYKREWTRVWRMTHPELHTEQRLKWQAVRRAKIRLERKEKEDRREEERPGYCSACGISLHGAPGDYCPQHIDKSSI